MLRLVHSRRISSGRVWGERGKGRKPLGRNASSMPTKDFRREEVEGAFRSP